MRIVIPTNQSQIEDQQHMFKALCDVVGVNECWQFNGDYFQLAGYLIEPQVAAFWLFCDPCINKQDSLYITRSCIAHCCNPEHINKYKQNARTLTEYKNKTLFRKVDAYTAEQLEFMQADSSDEMIDHLKTVTYKVNRENRTSIKQLSKLTTK